MAKVLCLLWLAAVCAPAQVVEGTVLNANTGAGIAGVGVNLEQITSGAYRVYQVRTDAQGHFRLDNVQDGTYRIGYATNDYWFDREFGEWDQIQVAAGGKPVEVEARMMPLPHVSGRVMDNKGNPVPGAHVRISGSGLFFSEEVGAAGKFDLKELPGAYVLSASAPAGWKPPDPDPETGQAMGWPETYYPGSAVAEGASKLAVRPGADVSDLELKLLAVPVHAVRGVLLNIDGKPVPKQKVNLADEEPLQPAREAETKADGAFEFPAVTDGVRGLSANVEIGGVKLRARQRLEMAGRDLEGIKLRLEAPFALRGKVVVETAQGMAPPKMPTVVLRSVDPEHESEFTELMSARPDADGAFTFPHVYPGTYRMDGGMAPGQAYLDSVRLGEAEVPGMQMELASGAPLLTVRYKTGGGTVRGAAENCTQGDVLLIPAEIALRRAGLARSGRCDANGRYEISGLRPGEYYALAFTRGGSSPFPQTEWDEGTLAQARRVTVRAGESTSADLTATARPAY